MDCRFTVAYWDWSAAASDPWSTSDPGDLWHSAGTGFGGDGGGDRGCVQTGLFQESEWSLVPRPGESESRCLERSFRGTPPDTVAVQEVLQISVDRFTTFEEELRRNLHDLVHCLILGTMCSVDAAAAPEFFLHHSFIDKIWEDWQKKSESHKNAFFPSVNDVMPGTNDLPTEYIDLSAQPGDVSVEYEPIATSNTIAASK